MDKLVIELTPTPKVIELIKKNAPESYIVAFKLESGLAKKELIDNATRRLNELNIDMIIANDLVEVQGEKGRVHIIKRNGKAKSIEGRKTDNANEIFNEILKE